MKPEPACVCVFCLSHQPHIRTTNCSRITNTETSVVFELSVLIPSAFYLSYFVALTDANDADGFVFGCVSLAAR